MIPQWEQQSTTTEPPSKNGQQTKPLGAFTGTKSSPYILLLLKHKHVKLAWMPPYYCNVFS